ncbi:MAG: hypothetical protein Kow0074_08120 [Candidatus Zixiibacteriota bacterium]
MGVEWNTTHRNKDKSHRISVNRESVNFPRLQSPRKGWSFVTVKDGQVIEYGQRPHSAQSDAPFACDRR